MEQHLRQIGYIRVRASTLCYECGKHGVEMVVQEGGVRHKHFHRICAERYVYRLTLAASDAAKSATQAS
jgi:hypothetical protein